MLSMLTLTAAFLLAIDNHANASELQTDPSVIEEPSFESDRGYRAPALDGPTIVEDDAADGPMPEGNDGVASSDLGAESNYR